MQQRTKGTVNGYIQVVSRHMNLTIHLILARSCGGIQGRVEALLHLLFLFNYKHECECNELIPR